MADTNVASITTSAIDSHISLCKNDALNQGRHLLFVIIIHISTFLDWAIRLIA